MSLVKYARRGGRFNVGVIVSLTLKSQMIRNYPLQNDHLENYGTHLTDNR